jgi:LAGLIDADG endonuclease
VNVRLVIPPFSGNTSFATPLRVYFFRKGYFSGQGPIFQVKTPFSRGQSAGNPLCSKLLFHFTTACPGRLSLWGSSETGRGKLINLNTCRMYSHVSIHRPSPQLPRGDTEFGFFLAGLIDSDGHFSKIPQLVISFHQNDIRLAYFIKASLGYGTVRKEKKKAAYRYILAHQAGLMKVAMLVHNKLCHKDKIRQYNERLISKLATASQCNSVAERGAATVHPFWLAGFIAGDGSFQIKFVSAKNRSRPEVRLMIQIDQKDESILRSLYLQFGGYLGYRKSQDTFYYSSVSFSNAAKLINYIDRAHLVGIKMTQYILWRRAFLIIQDGKHLTSHGLSLLTRIQKRINRLKMI